MKKIKTILILSILFTSILSSFSFMIEVKGIEQHEVATGETIGYIDCDNATLDGSNITQIIRPDGDAREHDTVGLYPDTGEDTYEDIDEAVADDDSTYIYGDNNGGSDSAKVYIENIPTNATPIHINVSFRAKITNIGNKGSLISVSLSADEDSLYTTYVNNTSYQIFNHSWDTEMTVSDLNSCHLTIIIYNVDSSYQTRMTQIYHTVHYSPGFVVYRNITVDPEKNNFSFVPSYNYSRDVTFKVPVSDNVVRIYNVTDNVGNVFASEVSNLASVVNNTYWYDSSNQYVYIGENNLSINDINGYNLGNSQSILHEDIAGNTAIRLACQQKIYYDNDLWWVFYAVDNSSTEVIHYSTSTDGVTWGASTEISGTYVTAGAYFSTWVQDGYLHYTRWNTPNDLFYRRGYLEADGTIIWTSNEVSVEDSAHDPFQDPNICVNSSGYPYIIATNGTGGLHTNVWISSTTDGTWSEIDGSPFEILHEYYTHDMILPLPNGEVYAICTKSDNPCYSYLWDGDNWGEQENITYDNTYNDLGQYSAVAIGQDIYWVHYNDTTKEILFNHRDYSTGWDGLSTLITGVGSDYKTSVDLTVANNDLFVYWINNETDTVQFRQYTNGEWESNNHSWFTLTDICARSLNSMYQMNNSMIGIGVNDNTSTYNLTFNFMNLYNNVSWTVNCSYGIFTINVYDENTSEAVTNWSLFISNWEGTSTYESIDNNNPFFIDVHSLPYGDNTRIQINSTTYENKVFYMNLEIGTSYILNVYLAENTSTEQYIISIVGPQTDYGYEPPIEDATVDIKRYINDSVGYQHVSILVTGANGQVSINLIPMKNYLITVSATGYDTEYYVFQPVHIEYSEDRYLKIRLTLTVISSEEAQRDIFWDDITFAGIMTGPSYDQLGNITITYIDSNSSTTNTAIYLFESYNGTNTLLDTDSRSSNSFSYTIGNINTTRLHYAVIYFNNTADYNIDSPQTITIFGIHVYYGFPSDFETRVRNVIGPFNIGDQIVPWADLISIIFPIILLVSFGAYNTGVGILSCGLGIGFMQVLMASLEAASLAIVALCPLVIVIGIIYIWTKEQGADQL